MCGIVGLFIKNKSLEPQLGALLSDMLITMTDRGPDSAGFAVYGREQKGHVKITIQSNNPADDFAELAKSIKTQVGVVCQVDVVDTHAVLTVDAKSSNDLLAALAEHHQGIRVMSVGENIEIYKEVGLPADVSARFGLNKMSGTHAIGHTRMATESAVTTMGAHPFSTADDQCMVHNGSLANHNNLRRALKKKGITIKTMNDTEVAAAYLSYRLQEGDSLGDALSSSLDDVDGFYTFLVGTKNGFGVLRDPIACKPAVMAETDDYVAFGSEYRALVNLPDIQSAKVWEPEPSTVYFWEQ